MKYKPTYRCPGCNRSYLLPGLCESCHPDTIATHESDGWIFETDRVLTVAPPKLENEPK